MNGYVIERFGRHDAHLIEELKGVGGPEDFPGLLAALRPGELRASLQIS
ncbi:hypothetical protein [Streptomyces sp. NPDC003032]